MIYTNDKKHLQQGFTLIELMITIAIIGFLMAGVYLATRSFGGRAKAMAAKQMLKTISSGIENFAEDTGQYPSSLDELTTKPASEELAKDWDGPYLKPKPKAPTGFRLHYDKTEGGEHEYELYFTTPDKKRLDVWKS